ncbi:ANTAR domain-containing protein [Micromonospora sp. NPDC050187]|uniref:ANTAR domain-containing protein n=1 Tax=Micromonospora sp. NPDC050187 TaxID=3364277 RepID=UPI0037982B92
MAERLQVDVGEAFALLRDGARSRNLRLSDLSQAIVDGSEQLAPKPAVNRPG